jgi:ABC-2 type transport system ATP-binding protein
MIPEKMDDMTKQVIETRDLTMYYGRHRGIEDVNLSIQQGEVFGFLGPNGAGKTTTLRVLLDVIRPTAGQAFLFGMDSRQQSREIHQKIGYVPGELSLPNHLTAQQFFDVLAGVRGLEDTRYQQALCERLGLDPSRRIREFSRGNKQKVGLVAALMHRPELLILDEPTTGLDPLVQRNVLELVRETRNEGGTVFFSSHILSEVQTVCDRVGVIREGRLIAVQRVADLIKRKFRRLRLTLEQEPAAALFDMDGVQEIDRFDNTITLQIHNGLQAVMGAALNCGLRDLEELPVTLEEIFMAYYGQGQGEHHA